MRADRSLEEVAWVLGIGGIELRCDVAVGTQLPLTELEREHDAVFVGVGLGADARLGVPGEGLPGVEGAVGWIERVKLGRVDLAGVRRCVVVGGGNTALDAVREALTLGVPEVTLLYRGDEARMSGYAHEWEAARLQGARATWQAQPIAFEGDGRLRRLVCQRLDAQRRPVPGLEFTVEADLVLVAIGQARLVDQLAALPGLRVEQGRLATDAHGFTGRPKWFAGGDCSNGGREVVNAAAEGKRAARAIHASFAIAGNSNDAAGAAGGRP
jgi:glutamate synthase (NADPH/NADH) small chain